MAADAISIPVFGVRVGGINTGWVYRLYGLPALLSHAGSVYLSAANNQRSPICLFMSGQLLLCCVVNTLPSPACL